MLAARRAGVTMLLRMSCCSLNMTRCRAGSGVRRQAGKASLAACTAAWNSAGVVSGQRDTTSCVAWRCHAKAHVRALRQFSSGHCKSAVRRSRQTGPRPAPCCGQRYAASCVA